ncbi:MAG: hypothetical protein IKS56_03315 [Lachnospiraceae bacterium]|nr:hypothetical protein [Lachnospiraceae bacterium]
MDATAIVCKQCGSRIPVVENVGKLICPSCGTEYILDNVEGEKILKEFHFENPFVGVQRIIDPDLAAIQERMEMYQDYANIYTELVRDEEAHSYKYGYWTLRLRAFTGDFKWNFDRYQPFEEINACVEEHSKLSEFTEPEEDCLAGYYNRNLPILEARLSQLKEENESFENELKKLKSEETKLTDEVSKLSGLIATPEQVSKNSQLENPDVYLWFKITSIASIAAPIAGGVLCVTIVLIPLGLLVVLAGVGANVARHFLGQSIVVIEQAYAVKIKAQIMQLRQRQADLGKNMNTLKEGCLKSFFEYKHTLAMYDIINRVLKKFFED